MHRTNYGSKCAQSASSMCNAFWIMVVVSILGVVALFLICAKLINIDDTLEEIDESGKYGGHEICCKLKKMAECLNCSIQKVGSNRNQHTLLVPVKQCGEHDYALYMPKGGVQGILKSGPNELEDEGEFSLIVTYIGDKSNIHVDIDESGDKPDDITGDILADGNENYRINFRKEAAKCLKRGECLTLRISLFFNQASGDQASRYGYPISSYFVTVYDPRKNCDCIPCSKCCDCHKLAPVDCHKKKKKKGKKGKKGYGKGYGEGYGKGYGEGYGEGYEGYGEGYEGYGEGYHEGCKDGKCKDKHGGYHGGGYHGGY